MKQSRAASLIESVVNVGVGFGLSLGLQATVLPALGVPMPLSVNLAFAGVMTAVSIARSFVLRRVFEALHIRRPLSPFMNAVIAERFRQIDEEGWSHEHDDAHDRGDLANAGAHYLFYAGQESPAPSTWAWEKSWWKPDGFRRDVVKGCALGIAEGEKFDRNRKARR
jgi:hypothetical protein